jgi:hypothetical protein
MDRQHLVFYTEPLPRSSRSSCGGWPRLCPIPAHTPAPCPALCDSHASKGSYLFLSAQAKNAYQSAKPSSQIVRNRLSTRDFRVLRVTESLTQAEEAAYSTALGKNCNPSQQPLLKAFIAKAQVSSQTQPAALGKNLARSKFLEVKKVRQTQPPSPHGPTLTQAGVSPVAYVLMWAGDLRTAEVPRWPEEDTEVREIEKIHGSGCHIRRNPAETHGP